MTHWTVLYKDSANQRQTFCCYAPNAWTARCAAIELNEYIHARPNSITHIIKEDPSDW